MRYSWVLFALSVWAIGYVTVVEIRAYRDYERNRAEFFPYSAWRLAIRMSVSVCLLLEALLLFGVWPLILNRPEFFLAYVTAVFGLALVLVALAILDWRESRRLQKLSKNRMLNELWSGLADRGSNEPN